MTDIMTVFKELSMLKKILLYAAAIVVAVTAFVSCTDTAGDETSGTRSAASRAETSREVSLETSRTAIPDVTSRVNTESTVSGLYSGEESVRLTVSQ